MSKLYRNHVDMSNIQNLREDASKKIINEIKGKVAEELYAFRAGKATTDLE
jgi:methyl coenzyme M reductase beta subunit